MTKQILQARITRLEERGDRVFRLGLEADEAFVYEAGQYLEIQVTEDIWAPFSIASAPHQKELELHIQYLPGREVSETLYQKLIQGGTLTLRLATGECLLPKEEQPLVLVAGGTGFAQMKSLLEAAFERGWQAPLTLYWGARNREGLYALDLARDWESNYSNFTLLPCVDLADADWKGRNCSLVESLGMDYIDPDSASEVKGFCSGSPALVYAIEDLMMTRGMPPRSLLSDVHAYAPRNYD
ncbi:FAD-binding oxidoreductase [Marinospirillum perlucidum]|uniref:FAD-binding oxidoreductase n=1 Tax=Marinospirillum perlucidum TaxID=1982602 RepID=UPI00138FD844|nr:FAD-binding oxidoreductase [Marinospirillum perlucidum]